MHTYEIISESLGTRNQHRRLFILCFAGYGSARLLGGSIAANRVHSLVDCVWPAGDLLGVPLVGAGFVRGAG